MNLTTLMQIGEGIDKDSSLVERAIVGAQVVAIGMGVIFGVLILLICILQVFKIFASEKPAQTETKAPAVAPSPAPAPVVATVASAPASEEEAIVAIATAAIAASRGESDCAFKVLSIKKIVK